MKSHNNLKIYCNQILKLEKFVVISFNVIAKFF